MSPKASKSKNLHLYPYFLNYDDPSDIPFDKLAKKLSVSPNRLQGMMRSAYYNSTIYSALRLQGYGDHHIPWWFVRPGEPLVYRRAASAEPRVSAEKRSGAEEATAPPMGDTMPLYMARERSAERSSVLSMRSAPPANLKPYQPVYQSPMTPLLEETVRQIRESHLEEMRASIDRGKQRRQPPKPISLDAMKARAEIFSIMQQLQAGNTFRMLSWIGMSQTGRIVQPPDVAEIKDAFTKPLAEMRSEKEWQLEEDRATFAAMGEILKSCVPQAGPPDDFIHSLEAANNDNRRRERQDIIYGVKILNEKRKNENIDLLFLDDQTKKLWKTFRTIIEQL